MILWTWGLIAWSVKNILIILILNFLRQENNRLIKQSKCSNCKNKKSRLVKEQETQGLLSNLGINTPFIKIPLLNVSF